MPSRTHAFDAFATLPSIARASDRAMAFRACFAELAATLSDRRVPAPLEGVDVDGLVEGIDVAVAEGCFASLDWLTPELALPAGFEIASTLPHGASKRARGRHVL